ncbi:hypothetical protein D3C85_362670 [compost metagenome]
MFEFFNGIFKINNFDLLDFHYQDLPLKFAYPNKNNKNQEFYVIVEFNSKNIDLSSEKINQTLEELMEKIESLEYSDESTKKNTTLILCVNERSISHQDILKIEENPYYFKKNVIMYNHSSIHELKTLLNGDYSNNSLNILLTKDGGVHFENFKTSDSYNYYSLLIEIITKLPFIHYHPQNNDLLSIDKFVKNDLNEQDNKLLDYVNAWDVSNEAVFIKTVMISDWNNI